MSQKLRGHFGYYRITGNSMALSRFRQEVTNIWRKWLSRRKRGGLISWTDFARMLARFQCRLRWLSIQYAVGSEIRSLRNRMR